MNEKIFINRLLLPSTPALPMEFTIVNSINDVFGKAFYFGTIAECQYAKNQLQSDITVSYWDLSVSSFMPAIGPLFINYAGSYYKQVCQIGQSDIGAFCRSDSGNKQWSGQIIEGTWDIETIKQRVQCDEMMFLSPAKTLPKEEYRCWVAFGEVVEVVCHDFSGTPIKQDKEKIAAVTERVLSWDSFWAPDLVYVVDVCEWKGEFYVVEYNCFSTSGHYSADSNKIAEKTREFLKKGLFNNGLECRALQTGN